MGRIYTFYRPKYVYLATVALIEVGSFVCAAAPTSKVFIIGKAILGLGGSGIFSGTIILIINAVPLRDRPKYQGMMGMVFGVGSVAGPLIGGALTTHLSWR